MALANRWGMAAMATEAGVAAASTAAVGFGLFNYNRAETQWICPRMSWGFNY